MPKSISFLANRKYAKEMNQTYAARASQEQQALSNVARSLRTRFYGADDSFGHLKKSAIDEFDRFVESHQRVSELEGKVFASEMKKEANIKLGFFERRRLEKNQALLAEARREFSTRNQNLQESIRLNAPNRNNADLQTLYKEASETLVRHQLTPGQGLYTDNPHMSVDTLTRQGYTLKPTKQELQAAQAPQMGQGGQAAPAQAAQNDQTVAHSTETEADARSFDSDDGLSFQENDAPVAEAHAFDDRDTVDMSAYIQSTRREAQTPTRNQPQTEANRQAPTRNEHQIGE